MEKDQSKKMTTDIVGSKEGFTIGDNHISVSIVDATYETSGYKEISSFDDQGTSSSDGPQTNSQCQEDLMSDSAVSLPYSETIDLQTHVVSVETKTDSVLDTTTDESKKCRIATPEYLSTLKPVETIRDSVHATTSGESKERSIATSENLSTLKSEQDTLRFLLKKLGIEDKFPGKITKKEAMSIELQSERSISHTDLPWLLIRNIIIANSDARDEKIEQSLESIDGENYINLSPLDIFNVVIQSCDPFSKGILYKKLYLSKIAIPLWFSFPTGPRKSISTWPLRSIVIELNEKEYSPLDIPTNIISFARIGRPPFSKSYLLNSLLSKHSFNTFYNRECPLGDVKRNLSLGCTEVFWLFGDDNKTVNTVINARGDLESDFKESDRHCLNKLTDILFLVIEEKTIKEQISIISEITLQFKKTVLFIHNPPNADQDNFLIELVLQNFTESNSNVNVIKLFDGECQASQRSIMKKIKSLIPKPSSISTRKNLRERLKSSDVLMDEMSDTFKIAKEEAKKCLDSITSVTDETKIKSVVTPAHYLYSKKLSELEIKLKKTQGLKEIESVRTEIKETFKTQLRCLSTELKYFANTLIKYRCKSCSQLQHFLECLSDFCEMTIRNKLPPLKCENEIIHKRLKTYKLNEEGRIKKELENSQKAMENVEFRIEHLFREIAYAYEACLRTNTLGKEVGLPEETDMADLFAKIISLGYPFEILDGDSFFLPMMWVECVLQRVDVNLNKERVLSLSVLGIQSSGKSTLLNCMFGSEFKASAGKCTRGVQLQLIPVNKCMVVPFKHVLLIDTEGLRPPEAAKSTITRDVDLATFVSGLGNLTFINTMGEDRDNITNIMQVVVHAFLRLKIANDAIDIRNRCVIIHQNISDVNAQSKMRPGFQYTINSLDSAARNAAKYEHISNISGFTDIIEFDVDNDVHYFPNLWDGNPPLARVNKAYTSGILDLRQMIMDMKFTSYKSIGSTITQIIDLWKGIRSGSFILAYRNSTEIIAYNWFETELNAKTCDAERLVTQKTQELAYEFNDCSELDQLEKKRNFAFNQQRSFIDSEKIPLSEKIQSLLENEDYRDVLETYKVQIDSKIDSFWKELESRVKDSLGTEFETRRNTLSLELIFTQRESELSEYTQELLQKGKLLENEKFVLEFEKIWQRFEKDLPRQQCAKITFEEKFEAYFRRIFSTEDFAFVKKWMEKTDWPNSSVEKLKGSFFYTGIINDDFEMLTNISKELKQTNTKIAETHVDSLFSYLDTMIENKCSFEAKKISDQDVNDFIFYITSWLEKMSKESDEFGFCIKKMFRVKIYIHTCSHASIKFKNHNKTFEAMYGFGEHLRRYKVRFKEKLKQSKIEIEHVKFSTKFSSIMKRFAWDISKKESENTALYEIEKNFPQKPGLMIQIITDLVQTGKFNDWMEYIREPKESSKKSFTRECKSYLFGNQSRYSEILSDKIRQFFRNVIEAVNASISYNPKNIGIWIDKFRSNMKGYKFPTEELLPLKHGFSERPMVSKAFHDSIERQLNQAQNELLNDIPNIMAGAVFPRDSPFERIFESRWGCEERCPYCGEVCVKNKNHTDKHFCIQHRPLGCFGRKSFFLKRVRLTSCHYDVQSWQFHKCEVFDYACNESKNTECSLIWPYHFYSNYKIYLPNWDIIPDNDQYASSKVWLWFIATFKHDLKDRFDVGISNVPPEWDRITKTEAIQSYQYIMTKN